MTQPNATPSGTSFGIHGSQIDFLALFHSVEMEECSIRIGADHGCMRWSCLLRGKYADGTTFTVTEAGYFAVGKPSYRILLLDLLQTLRAHVLNTKQQTTPDTAF